MPKIILPKKKKKIFSLTIKSKPKKKKKNFSLKIKSKPKKKKKKETNNLLL